MTKFNLIKADEPLVYHAERALRQLEQLKRCRAILQEALRRMGNGGSFCSPILDDIIEGLRWAIEREKAR